MYPAKQGLTLVHFMAQRKRFLWNWGCILGLLRGCLRGAWEVLGDYQGVFMVYFASETAQVELRSGECVPLPDGCSSRT